MINKGTKLGVEGTKINIHTPLIQMKKSEIIKIGADLSVNYTKTVSCYSLTENGEACGICDSCRFRKQGFLDAGVLDPTLYKKIK
jgi:7-cyano-7-deazaguanine synthase